MGIKKEKGETFLGKNRKKLFLLHLYTLENFRRWVNALRGNSHALVKLVNERSEQGNGEQRKKKGKFQESGSDGPCLREIRGIML